MKIAVFGGSFNPPHLGHRSVVSMVSEHVHPDLFLIIPDNVPPHKELEEGSPDSATRLRMCIDNFDDLPGVQISDMEISAREEVIRRIPLQHCGNSIRRTL